MLESPQPRLALSSTLALALLAAPVCLAQAREPEALEPLLEPLAREWRVPALAAAVVRDGRIVAAGVVGVRVAGSPDPALRTDPFYLASCGKTVTATVVARLVERGVLDWEMTLPAALPRIEMHPGFETVQVRDLFSHRAGVFRFVSPSSETVAWESRPAARETRQEFAEWVLGRRPDRDDGASYSNGGLIVAGAIAEQVTGTSFEELAEVLLFEPAGLESFAFGWPATPARPDAPRGHFRESGEVRPAVLGSPARMPAFFGPAGHLHGSILDFARFAALHLRGLKGEDGLLAAETIRWLHTLPGDDSSPWAYGGWRVGRDVHSHGGSTSTFRSYIALYPEADLGIVMMQNVGEMGREAEGVVELLRDRYAPELDRIRMRFSGPSGGDDH